ncbi:Tim44/TimA family putative adaptor protein [Candidatus Mesenet endosymbiont of Phosphuga atrata]|uniref:Tim44/TimA family putative adaptor protein n=1 Tax=Candidatus Mesenet endosymbiont of Phosphuga atrata TaxID=3066221 RepID=UPI0030CD9539
MIELAVYALIAVFIFSRLYHSLGKAPILGFKNQHSNVIDNHAKIEDEESKDENITDYIDQNNGDLIKAGITAIKSKDKNFSVKSFMRGASTAFDLIIKAFNIGNLEQLKSLLDSNLYSLFEQEIKKHKELSEIHESTIVSIKSQKIIEVKLVKNTAFIAVNFLSEQINYAKNQSGELISGSISKINKVEDTWQFKKNITSSKPKWLLTSINYSIS